MESAIGSELHARLVPDAWWPQPIRALLDQARRENGGVLPDEFDLPIPDACIYVDVEPSASGFRRLEFDGNRLLVVFRFKTAPSPRPEGYRPEPATMVIDERAMKAFRVPDISGRLLEVFVLDDAMAILFIDRGRLTQLLHKSARF